MIVREKGGWSVKSEGGKHLGGPYKSKHEAHKRLAEVEYFKSQDKKKGTQNMDRTLERLTVNLAGRARYETLEGRRYLVAPMVMLTEGVHQGSKGPLYYPKEELSRRPMLWNHKPVVVYHPEENGKGTSACTPEVLAVRKIGIILNTQYKEEKGRGKLIAEAWCDVDRMDKVDPRVRDAIEKNEKMEVSTGLFTENEQTEGTWNDESYKAIARDHGPDHLAVLPDKVGACSIKDGAGLLANEEDEEAFWNELQELSDRWPKSRRDKLDKGSFAGPHQSFPIESQKDVQSAASLLHHADNPEAVRRKVVAIAKRKGLTLPDSWRTTKNEMEDPVYPIDNASSKMSHEKIRNKINQKLADDAKAGADSNESYYYPSSVMDVYDDFYVARDGRTGKMHKQPYKMDGGNVKHTGKRESVDRHSEYRRVSDGSYVGHATYNQKEDFMTKNEMVDALLANSAFGEEDREWLESLDESRIQQLSEMGGKGTNIKGPATKGAKRKRWDTEEETETDQDMEERKKATKNAKNGNGKDDTEEEEEEKKDKQRMAKNQVLSVDDYIRNAPPRIREVIVNSMEALDQEKLRLVELIKNSKGYDAETYPEDRLLDDAFPIKDLRAMAALAQPQRSRPNYAGQGAGRVETNTAVEEPLPMPTMNFAKK
jgi:hypothetical protein